MNQALSGPKVVVETHTVDAEIERQGQRAIVRPGQKCPHCSDEACGLMQLI